ncbi:MAG: glucans biosynthesis glucosyltransferase MdoH [Alphaproteobacteria bacterium]
MAVDPRPSLTLVEPATPAPAGLPPAARRAIVLALNLATIALLGWGVADVLGGDGWSVADVVIFAGFLVAAPWTTLGFWNAAIGLALLHGPWARPERTVYPYWAATERSAPLTARTALAMVVRNEDPAPSFRALAAMRDALAAEGVLPAFRFYVLSDSSKAEIAAAEEALFADFAGTFPADNRPVYRRREVNTGYKAGNVADFLARWGDENDFFVTLDADSLIAADTLVRMVRAMQADPKLGLLQTLVVGAPADSAFARIFQFGMRHGMRSFTMGSAWWTGDCGPYWGHNAIARTAAFRDHCQLPVLPGGPPLGGHILSHDQLEAAFLRRAGWAVRVLPIETASYEQNPPSVAEFAYRDMRWCQGNMQYWRFLVAPGLRPVSRFQIAQALLMYVAAPAWMAMTLATTVKAMMQDFRIEDLDLGIALFIAVFAMSLAPKLAGFADVALTKGGLARYGGGLRFGVSALLEVLFSMLLAPAMALNITIFMIGLLFGRSISWSGQNRAVRSLSWVAAWRGLWPQTLLGAVLIGVLSWTAPLAVAWGAPILFGLLLAVPLGVATARPRLGRWLGRHGLFAGPEDFAPPPILPQAGLAPLPLARPRVDELPRAAE